MNFWNNKSLISGVKYFDIYLLQYIVKEIP